MMGRPPASPGGPPERCAEWLCEKEPVLAQVRAWCGAPAVDAFDELTALRNEKRACGRSVATK